MTRKKGKHQSDRPATKTPRAADWDDRAMLHRPAPADQPSREEEEPTFARNVGTVGACFLLFGIGMAVWNAYQARLQAAGEATTYIFRPAWIPRLWCVLGVLGLLFHAAKDGAVMVRRAYGLLGYSVVSLAAALTAMTLGTLWFGASVAPWVAAGLGLGLALVTTAPFVREHAAETSGFLARWRAALRASAAVRKVLLFGVITQATFVVLACLFVRQFAAEQLEAGLVPYIGFGGMVLGVFFVLAYAANESEPDWRGAGVCMVGALGLVAAAIGLSSVVTDWLRLQPIFLPYGLTLGVLGLLYLWAFVVTEGSETDVGYWSAVAMGAAGGLVMVLALLRGFVPALAFPDPAEQIPSAFLLTAVGLLYVAVGAGLASDNRLVVMTRRELAATFYSPIAYAVITAIGLISWLAFRMFVGSLLPERGPAPSAPEPIIQNYLWFFPALCLLFLVPAVTMRLLSEEQRAGTVEVLLTAPVSEAAVVLSKFIAAWVFFTLAWGVWAFFPLALRIGGQEAFDYRPLLSFHAGTAVMSAGLLSVGLFFSSATRNQIIAYLAAFAVIILLGVPYIILFVERIRVLQLQLPPNFTEAQLELLRYVAYPAHLEEFSNGRIHLRFVAFYGSMAVFFLFLTIKVLEARKWR